MLIRPFITSFINHMLYCCVNFVKCTQNLADVAEAVKIIVRRRKSKLLPKTASWSLCQFWGNIFWMLMLKDRGSWWRKRSPTSQNCRKHILSPTSNIDVAQFWNQMTLFFIFSYKLSRPQTSILQTSCNRLNWRWYSKTIVNDGFR